MSAPPPMAPLSGLRDRVSGAVVDPAPLRRAGLLAVALVVLLVVGRAFGPAAAASSSPAERQTRPASAEQVAAPASSWTGGRVLAVVLLVAGGGVALVLRRRSGPVPSQAALEVLGSHTLGPGHSLRLVGCGGEVMLLSVGGDGARLLRHWPRAAFEDATLEDRQAGAADAAPSFADVLAQAAPGLEDEDSQLEADACVLEDGDPTADLEVGASEAGASGAGAPGTARPAPALEAAPLATAWPAPLPQFGAHA